MDDQLRFLLAIAQALDDADISYMVTGSVALAVYATPRMTRDIDVVVELMEADVRRIVAAFEEDCFIDPESVQRAVATRGMFNIIHNDWIVKADFVVKKEDAYRTTEFERRRTIKIDGQPVSFVSPEDLILSKLWWGKESRSEMQERDVRDLLDVADDLDLDYLQRWASELGVGAQLDLIRNQ